MVHRIIYFRLGNKKFHLLKLIGAFLIFASLIEFLSLTAQMFDSIQAIKNYPKCIEHAKTILDVKDCQERLRLFTGITLHYNQGMPSTRQIIIANLVPLGYWLLWIVVLLIGITLYRTGKIPVVMDEREERKKTRKKKKE